MRFAAIDPGLDGAIAFADTDSINMVMPDGVYDMPTVKVQKSNKQQRFVSAMRLRLLLAQQDVDRVFIERTWGGGRGGSNLSFFKQGMTYGVVIGVCAGMNIPHTLITPQAWQKHAGVIGLEKADHRVAAAERWPAHATRFHRVKDDGRADAALLLAYAVDREQGLVA